ncbi:hypothetical protein PMAYCL1PPCAC_02284, partial [Pristionchus mayeri]
RDYRQEKKDPAYDVDACYGWIGEKRPKKGEIIGSIVLPTQMILLPTLVTPSMIFDLSSRAEYERYSENRFVRRNQCIGHHLYIVRLHHLDEGGLFSYHYTRVRMVGNKIQVTFFALKDVLGE